MNAALAGAWDDAVNFSELAAKLARDGDKRWRQVLLDDVWPAYERALELEHSEEERRARVKERENRRRDEIWLGLWAEAPFIERAQQQLQEKARRVARSNIDPELAGEIVDALARAMGMNPRTAL